jgi:hypothetical protein
MKSVIKDSLFNRMLLGIRLWCDWPMLVLLGLFCVSSA